MSAHAKYCDAEYYTYDIQAKQMNFEPVAYGFQMKKTNH
jgi:hypothetical protein